MARSFGFAFKIIRCFTQCYWVIMASSAKQKNLSITLRLAAGFYRFSVPEKKPPTIRNMEIGMAVGTFDSFFWSDICHQSSNNWQTDIYQWQTGIFQTGKTLKCAGFFSGRQTIFVWRSTKAEKGRRYFWAAFQQCNCKLGRFAGSLLRKMPLDVWLGYR